MAANEIGVRRSDGVAWVTLERPHKRNALSVAMVRALTAIFRETASNDSDRVLVLQGGPEAFCAGIDLAERGAPVSADEARRHMEELSEMASALYHLSKPTLAVVRGVAVGAGMALAVGCDLVLASETARFSTMFVNRALSLDAGTAWLLPRLVGMGKAKELAFFGDFVTAEEAQAIGIVNRVLPDDDLDEYAKDWARRLADGPAMALSISKSLLNQAWSSSFDEILVAESNAQALNALGEDVAEAISAFFEDRRPHYVRRSRPEVLD